MIKRCGICSHVGELTWRDGKYYCAMCGSEIAETEPVTQTQYQAQPRSVVTTSNVMCPICRNKDNNLFDGMKYRCALCGTSFDLQQTPPPQQQYQYQQQGYQQPYNNGAPYYNVNSQRYAALKKDKDKKVTLGIVFIFLFWPASIYFFYKAYQLNEEMKMLRY